MGLLITYLVRLLRLSGIMAITVTINSTVNHKVCSVIVFLNKTAAHSTNSSYNVYLGLCTVQELAPWHHYNDYERFNNFI